MATVLPLVCPASFIYYKPINASVRRVAAASERGNVTPFRLLFLPTAPYQSLPLFFFVAKGLPPYNGGLTICGWVFLFRGVARVQRGFPALC